MANGRQRIVDAALETLREKGFAGSSTRAIATRGGFQPGLIFYYFDTHHDLLIAALEHANDERRARFEAQVADATSIAELVALLERIYHDDRDSGYIHVVSEMIAGGVAHPELGARVVELMEPWIAAAQAAAERAMGSSGLGAVVPARQLAVGAVMFYLGANLMTRLVPESGDVEALLTTAKRLAPMLDLLGAGFGGQAPPPPS